MLATMWVLHQLCLNSEGKTRLARSRKIKPPSLWPGWPSAQIQKASKWFFKCHICHHRWWHVCTGRSSVCYRAAHMDWHLPTGAQGQSEAKRKPSLTDTTAPVYGEWEALHSTSAWGKRKSNFPLKSNWKVIPFLVEYWPWLVCLLCFVGRRISYF